MRVFNSRSDLHNCLITATVVLFSVASFLWVLELGGYISAAICMALVVGFSVRYRLAEPQRIRAQVRLRTLALQDLAYRDGLTGLPNRRFFNWYLEQYLPRLLKRACSREFGAQQVRRPRRKLHTQVIMFDLNGFKAINDTYGHDAGDALLKFISDTLSTYLPQNTVLARLGGDEFVVIVRDRDGGGKVHAVVKAIRHSVGSTLVFGHHRIQVSASVGVSAAVSGIPQAGELLREADQRMYADKASHYEGCTAAF